MRFKFTFIIFIFFFFSKAQKSVEYIQMPTCEEGVKDAISDADKGFFVSKSYGLTLDIKFDGFADFYNSYLKNQYKISFENGGCVSSNYSECYKKTTEELIIQKYGDDIYVRARKEAAIEFKKTNEFLEIVKPKIDSGYVYSFVSFGMEPKFLVSNQETDFIKYLGFPNFQIDYFNPQNYCRISFVVEKDGSLSKFSLKNAKTLEEINNQKLKKKLRNSPKWLPANYLEEVIRYEVSYKVPLSLL